MYGPGVSRTMRVGPLAARRPVQQRLAQRVEERREVLDRQLAEHLREDARDDEPVLERIARPRRRLRAVADDPPAPVGRAREVGGVLQEVAPADRVQPFGRREEAAVAEDHGGRDRAALHQRLRAVKIAEDAVEQLGALLDPRRDAVPFLGRQHERDRVDFPRPVHALRIGVDVVGDAVLADLALGERQRVAHVALVALGERAHERVPVRPRPAGGGQQLVEAPLGRRIAGEELIQHGERTNATTARVADAGRGCAESRGSPARPARAPSPACGRCGRSAPGGAPRLHRR